MSDKIVNFDIANADDAPIDKGSLIKNLHRVPKEIYREYLEVVDDYLEGITALRNAIFLKDRQHSFRYYLDIMTNDQLNNLNQTVLHLASVEPERHIRELQKATFGFSVPTPETILKSLRLMAKLKSLNKEDAEKLSKFTTIVSDTMITLKMGSEFESLALWPLSRLTENDLDKLIEIACNKFFNGYNA